MNQVFAIVALLSCAWYVYFVLSARFGLRHAASVQPNTAIQPSVTILVALKNEEHNVARLTGSLSSQDYPTGKLQIILVDDASTDGTKTQLQEFAKRDSRARLVSAPVPPTNTASVTGGKARALAEGIRIASGEILLMTDADCEPAPSWAKTMAGMFEESVAYVVGPVAERSPGLFGAVKALDYFGVVATSAGKIGMGNPVNSLGANVAFRKSVYERAGGFALDRRLGDEEYLMHAVHERGLGRVLFCAHPEAKVITHGNNSIKDFWNQRVRWASMKDRYPRKGILLELFAVFIFFLTIIAAAVLSVVDSSSLTLLGITLFSKIIADAAALYSAGTILEEKISFGTFLLSELVHVPFVVIVVIAAQVSAVRWKVRSVPV